jgi:type IV secretory pathway VirB4 component
MDSVTAHNLVKAQRTNAAGSMAEVMKRASQQGYDATLTNPDLANNFNEANALLQDIESRDQKLYESKFHVVIFGDTLKELDNHCTIFLAKCRTRDVEFEVASGLQENAFLSSIPFGIDNTPASRTLTTETLAVCAIPFSCQEMTMRGGICYGKNKVSHNVVSYNRMAGDSYGMLVLGFTGSGKSFFVKKEIANTFLAHGKDADVIIIDPQAEYGKLCRACGGTEINIKSSGEHHINPMDISKDYGDGDPVSDKEDFVQSMMTEILSYTPDATQRSAISIATMRCYDAWKLSGEDKDIPTMETFYRELCNYYNSDGCSLPSVLDLVKAVEYYVCGTATLFQGASNVDINSSFVSYNISELGESIRPLAMLVILDSILNRMSRNRKLNRPTYVYIDEMHLLFRKQQTADFIKKLWKVGRKYKLAQCGITQDVPDLLGNTAGIAVLSNTAMVVLLKQAPINQGVLQEQLNLSERQLEYITDTPPGEGLLYIANSSRFSGGVIPFEDHYPEDSLLYEICQTSSVNEDGE